MPLVSACVSEYSDNPTVLFRSINSKQHEKENDIFLVKYNITNVKAHQLVNMYAILWDVLLGIGCSSRSNNGGEQFLCSK